MDSPGDSRRRDGLRMNHPDMRVEDKNWLFKATHGLLNSPKDGFLNRLNTAKLCFWESSPQHLRERGTGTSGIRGCWGGGSSLWVSYTLTKYPSAGRSQEPGKVAFDRGRFDEFQLCWWDAFCI